MTFARGMRLLGNFPEGLEKNIKIDTGVTWGSARGANAPTIFFLPKNFFATDLKRANKSV
jgi:hypothetical protein